MRFCFFVVHKQVDARRMAHDCEARLKQHATHKRYATIERRTAKPSHRHLHCSTQGFLQLLLHLVKEQVLLREACAGCEEHPVRIRHGSLRLADLLDRCLEKDPFDKHHRVATVAATGLCKNPVTGRRTRFKLQGWENRWRAPWGRMLRTRTPILTRTRTPIPMTRPRRVLSPSTVLFRLLNNGHVVGGSGGR